MIYSTARTSATNGDSAKKATSYNDPNRFIKGTGAEEMKKRASIQVAMSEAEKAKRTEARVVNTVVVPNDEPDTAAILEAWHQKRRLKEQATNQCDDQANSSSSISSSSDGQQRRYDDSDDNKSNWTN